MSDNEDVGATMLAAKQQYRAGRDAFERGEYRQSVQCLEKSASLTEFRTQLGGEVRLWLVTAYEAAGQQVAAIALCEELSRHPDLSTRQQGKRLLYILQAPRLKTRSDWLTQIPDLAGLDDSTQTKGTAVPMQNPARSRSNVEVEPEPINWTQVNTRDNRFVWVALGFIVLTLAGLIWLGM
jgi:hypothetical protein